jgi:hypothetical protein
MTKMTNIKHVEICFCKFVTFKDYCDNASQIQEQRCMFTEIKRDQLLFLNMHNLVKFYLYFTPKVKLELPF